MKFKNYFEKVKEFKKELDTQEEFSPREKEIILESWLKNIPSQLGKKEDSNNVEITSPRLDEEKRQIQIPESFASLINKAKSTQHSDHIMLAVYYIVIQKNYESASVKDIGDEYKKAYLRPSNTNVYLANLSIVSFLSNSFEIRRITAHELFHFHFHNYYFKFIIKN